METAVSFGLWLEKRRKALDLTREELARRIGSSASALRKIESDERRPSKQLAELLANALDIPAHEHASFIRIARGELSVERMKSSPLPTLSQLQSPPTVHKSIPVPLTPLIGRANELTALRQMLADAHCRLITLVGPGGSGKTRLAMEIAVEQGPNAALVLLASVNSTSLMVPAIAEALGFAFYGSADPKVQLLNYLRDKHILLVLDNMEHLLDGADLVAEILRSAPYINILCTSREPFNLRGEWVFEVGGLGFPKEEEKEETGTYGAILLFQRCAERTKVGFALSAEDVPVVVRICKLVEGMPLAIELAATWVNTLSCREIAAEIEHNLDILSTATRDMPERHRSMQAVFEHSWSLLTNDERRALSRLSVFRGGFTREAADWVSGTSLTLLAALMSKSLVYRDASGRYDLHELTRQYAALRLRPDSPEYINTSDRHSHFYLEWLSSVDGQLKSAMQSVVVAKINTEFDNIRSAWDWANSHHKAADLLHASRTLFWWFETLVRYLEGFTMFQQTVTSFDLPEETLTTQARDWQVLLGNSLANCEYLGLRNGLPRQSKEPLLRSIALLRALGAESELAHSQMICGIYLSATGNPIEGEAHLREAQHYNQVQHRTWEYAFSTFYLGYILQLRGQISDAYNYFSEALTTFRTTGDSCGIARTLCFLGFAAITKEQGLDAYTFAQEALTLSREIGDRWAEALALNVLAVIASAKHEYLRARDLFQKSLALCQSLSAVSRIGGVLHSMAYTELEAGNITEAQRAFQDAIAANLTAQLMPIVVDALVGLAMTYTASDPERALSLVVVALNHPLIPVRTRSRAEQLCAELEMQLSQLQIGNAQEATFDAVIAEIIKNNHPA